MCKVIRKSMCGEKGGSGDVSYLKTYLNQKAAILNWIIYFLLLL